ncbi:16S rRNA (cytosine(1402)-N(4))-methyltransferase RsmH [Mesohalobacter halotolerans]|uniref:Ribosomal RNA small subunit methyltransferase H n=1 Tax=Mesohalobacter halotolerans TaxID=1883405 RepID=A0A4U5TUN6_9FLAO|nr:16S rRNA (cytosine(1402)-N(4))-methyltransferase RsmH [Mesohalobacter halotolerans]MBS3738846.1 16S rRNA (cytosine(1402)-N(4))-methyltransferase RsmH [Psychroflexus sp.]TKS57661.1 16S rRNA (cytosine(1402)-N(4))-methyltransferase RsmH [Mesohalobacter halotolerans]
MTQNDYHIPVLRKESVKGLNIKPDGIYVDATFGGGGHSREILSQLNAKGKLIGFDQDEAAVNNKIDDKRFLLIPENFRYLKRFLKFYKIDCLNGILADFGVSSHQFNTAERGFSLRYDADLDMRMSQSQDLNANQIVNTYTEDHLSKIIKQYAELRMAPKLASAIVSARQTQPIETTFQLNAVLEPFLPSTKVNKFLAQIYQALRIEVNQEIEALKDFLMQTAEVVIPGGRLSLISYHSLEDRLVKHFIRSGNFDDDIQKDFYGNVKKPFKKVGKLIVPGQEETENNNRSRSAKLRIAEKI